LRTKCDRNFALLLRRTTNFGDIAPVDWKDANVAFERNLRYAAPRPEAAIRSPSMALAA
jgi:hypothetical protein